jgi:gamma-glutamyltranspeptidase / glutathione hydrolase
MLKENRRLVFMFFSLLALLLVLALIGPSTSLADWPNHSFKQCNRGVVAVSTPLAAEVGAQVLEDGGNAVDAAVAIQFALNVVEPQYSGIGGGGFMMIHLAQTGMTFIVDCREKAPAAATPGMFLNTNGTPLSFTEASTSGISVGVPGTLLGVATALKKWGTIPLWEAINPAIKLAEDGFAINSFLALDDMSPRTAYQPETKAVFRLPDGTPLPQGFILKQPDLAKTLKLIAKKGPDVFYKGEIAQAIVEAQKRTRTPDPTVGVGRMTLKDLKQYNVAIRQPVVDEYRGYIVKSTPPPSSGGLTVLQMLKMLERFPLGDQSKGFGFGATNTLHVMIEAMRVAFADRAVWMGDEDFVHVPKIGLLADAYVAMRGDLIHLDSRMANPSAGDPRPYDYPPHHCWMKFGAPADQPEGGHTTHFAVIDKRGNIVSYTTTIEQGWGSGIMVPGYGFLLNNELTDFNFTPTYNADPNNFNPGANDVAAFKRPRSSMMPTMLFKHCKPIAAYGSPGGATIINSVFQATLNLIDHEMTIQQAIDAPRISVTSTSGFLSLEAGFSAAALQGLKDLGHNVPTGTTSIGSVQGIYVDPKTGSLSGGADHRREGTVIVLPRH